MQIDVLQELAFGKLFASLCDPISFTGPLLCQLLPREDIHQLESQLEKVLNCIYLLQGLRRVQRAKIVVSLASFIAEHVLFPTEYVALLLDEFVEIFDEAFSINVLVLFLSLLEIVDSFDGGFVDLVRKNTLFDDSASTEMYRSRMMRFLRM